jgi:hypothetical protein
MTARLAMGLGALSLAMATPALADITITDANVPGNPAQNVLLGGDETGLTVVGLSSITSTSILFTGQETLTEPASGAARIEATDDGFTDLVISLMTPGLFFTKLEFNLNASADGDVTITAVDNFDVAFSETFTLDGNGENRINIFRTNNQLIKSVTIDSEVDLQDIRQVRVEGNPGFGVNPTAIVPEPGTWALMLLGFFGAGACLRSRRAATARA